MKSLLCLCTVAHITSSFGAVISNANSAETLSGLAQSWTSRTFSLDQTPSFTTLKRAIPSSSSSTATQTILVTTSGQSTWSETFVETSLTQFASVTAPTTFTTTDASGNIALGIAFAGGLAWLGIPAALPPINPPPEIPEATAQPPSVTSQASKTKSSPSSTSSSTSSTTSLKATQTAIVQFAHPSAQVLRAAISSARIVPNDVIVCASSIPSATVDRNTALQQLQKFCEAQDGKKIDGTDANSQEFDLTAGLVLQASLGVNKACSGLTIKGNNATCVSAYRELLDNCAIKSLQKPGGSVNDGCTVFNANIVEHPGTGLTCNKPVSPDTGIQRSDAISNTQAFCKMNRSVRTQMAHIELLSNMLTRSQRIESQPRSR
jgi:hypothetical protein